MNILFIVDSLTGGGAEKVTSILASQICHNRDDKVYLLVDERKDDEYTVDPNVKILSLDRKHYKFAPLNIYQKIRKYIYIKKIKKQYDIHCSIGMLPLACFYNSITKRDEKVINSIRIKLSASEYPKYLLAMMKYAIKHADLTVAVSECVRRDAIRFCGLSEKSIVTIYNPCDIDNISSKKNLDVDPRIVQNFEKWDFVLATHGRLTVQKGQWHLIRIVRSLINKGYNIGLFILGAGELKEKLQEMIDLYDLNDYVMLLGYDTNPYRYLKYADIYAFGSLYEGFPNALLDAMAVGLPIVSSDGESGIRELLAPDTDCEYEASEVEYAKYGVLVPRFTDDINIGSDMDSGESAMELAILKMISDSKIMEEYASKSLERIGDYGYSIVTNEWNATIKQQVRCL